MTSVNSSSSSKTVPGALNEANNDEFWKKRLDQEFGWSFSDVIERGEYQFSGELPQDWKNRYNRMVHSPLTKLCCVQPRDIVTVYKTELWCGHEEGLAKGYKFPVISVSKPWLDVQTANGLRRYSSDHFCSGFHPNAESCELSKVNYTDQQDIRSGTIELETPILLLDVDMKDSEDNLLEEDEFVYFLAFYKNTWGNSWVAFQSYHLLLADVDKTYMQRAEEVCKGRSCRGFSAIDGITVGLANMELSGGIDEVHVGSLYEEDRPIYSADDYSEDDYALGAAQ